MIVGIETGGTKVMVAASEGGSLAAPSLVRRFPTTDPQATIDAVNAVLDEVAADSSIEAIGVASFGPVEVDRRRGRYGWIAGTAKPGWADTDLLGGLVRTAEVPTAFMSDVSGAALGEALLGAGRGVDSAAFATIGTGVGVGVVRDRRVVQGDGWPELGHLMIRRHRDDRFEGACPFHGDCAEGLVAGPAVLARWGVDASHLSDRDREGGLEILGYYVAQVVAAVAYAHGVDRVVLGGGVMQAPGLLESSRKALRGVLGGPLAGHPVSADPVDFLVPAELGSRSGVIGALVAAARLVARPAGRLPVVAA